MFLLSLKIFLLFYANHYIQEYKLSSLFIYIKKKLNLLNDKNLFNLPFIPIDLNLQCIIIYKELFIKL